MFAGLTEDGFTACILPRAGGVAQSVERYVRNVEVGGSSPLTSTRKIPGQGPLSLMLQCRSQRPCPRNVREPMSTWRRAFQP
jgi:hypothetical protein